MKAPGLDLLLEEYISQFEVHSGAGLLVVGSSEDIPEVSAQLSKNDILESKTWWSALQRLASAEVTFIVLDLHMCDELLDIVRQVVQRRGEVTIRDSKTREVQRAHVRQTQPLLLVVATQECVSSTKSFVRLTEGMRFVRFVE